MDKNMKFGLIVFISIIALFVLSLLISQTPNNVDNSVRFGILTLIPPLVAIGLAFLTKQTIISLFAGVFIGEFMLNVNDYNILTTIISAFLDIGTRIISCMADPWNVGIILQCLLIGGVIQLITKMGGAKALGEAFVKKADTPKKSSVINLAFGFICIL